MISDGKKIAQDEWTQGTKRVACMGGHPCKTVHPGHDMKTSKRRETPHRSPSRLVGCT